MSPATRALPLPLAALVFVFFAGTLAGPADALEKKPMGDLVVPEGRSVEEAQTAWGDVTVRGRVEDDVSSALGDIDVTGPVGGDVQAGMGDVFVDGYVGGDVSLGRGNLRLGRNARVKGDVHVGGGTFEHHPEAEYGGLHAARMAPGSDGGPLAGTFDGLLGRGIFAVLLAAAGVLAVVVVPRPLKASASHIDSAPGRALLLGLASLPAVVVVCVSLALTGVGILLVPLFLPAYLALVLFGTLVAAYALGRKVLFTTGGHRAGDAVAAAVGAIVIAAFTLVPFLGGLLLALLALLGAGAVLLALLARRRGSSTPAHPGYASYEEYLEARRR